MLSINFIYKCTLCLATCPQELWVCSKCTREFQKAILPRHSLPHPLLKFPVYSALDYNAAVKRWVSLLKTQPQIQSDSDLFAWAESLCLHYLENIRSHRPDLVISIPSHPLRIAFSNPLSSQLGQIWVRLLEADPKTCFALGLGKNLFSGLFDRPQKFQNRKERLQTLKFPRFHWRIPETHIRGQKVFIVDDVLTTGCTLKSAADFVSKAGGKVVGGFVLARVFNKTSLELEAPHLFASGDHPF